MGKPRGGYEYARSQNPTRERLERAVAALEGGTTGIAFASGSATTAAIAELAGAGDEIVVGDDVYGGTFRYLERVHRGNGVDSRYVDLSSRAGRALGGADRTDEAGLVRDAVQPACSRSWTSRRSRPTRRSSRRREWGSAAAHRGRQHVRVAGPPATADRGRRHRLPLGHEVPRRPLGHDPGHRRDFGSGGRGATAVPAERDGRGPRAARLLPGPARAADAPPADGAARVERRGRGRVPARASGRGDRLLPRVRRHGLVPARGGLPAVGAPRIGRSPSPKARACSRSRSRSAAWSRSSRSPPS